MLAKKTSKNQITLPKAVVTRFAGVDYFDVSTDGKCIIMKPLRESRADEIRAKLAELGITEADVADAVRWARENPSEGMRRAEPGVYPASGDASQASAERPQPSSDGPHRS